MATVDYQREILALGLRVFPLHGKKPPRGFLWKDRAALHPVSTESYGIACDDKIAVIDADTRERAVWWWHNRERTPWLVRTPSGGVHFVYGSHPDARNAQRIDGEIDVRANGGYIVGVGSRIRARVYELIGKITLDLPQFDPRWISARTDNAAPPGTPLTSVVEPNEDIVVRIQRARGFLRHVVSVSGSGTGDKELFRAASVLIQKFELPEAVALEELRRWNTSGNAQPPWPDHRLRHKIEQAIKVAGT